MSATNRIIADWQAQKAVANSTSRKVDFNKRPKFAYQITVSAPGLYTSSTHNTIPEVRAELIALRVSSETYNALLASFTAAPGPLTKAVESGRRTIKLVRNY